MTESARTIIIDHGSDMIKAGFAGDEAPRAEFYTTVSVLGD